MGEEDARISCNPFGIDIYVAHLVALGGFCPNIIARERKKYQYTMFISRYGKWAISSNQINYLAYLMTLK